MRTLLILALLAGAAVTTACQSTSSSPGVSRMTVYGQPCNTRSREAGLCRTVYR